MVTTAGSSEDWAYFLSQWSDNIETTKVTCHDRIVQLLDCCDKHLCKDLTRSAGGSLSTKSEAEVLEAIKKFAIHQKKHNDGESDTS